MTVKAWMDFLWQLQGRGKLAWWIPSIEIYENIININGVFIYFIFSVRVGN